MTRSEWDVVIVGGGHNALVAAAYLARAGRSVVVLERAGELGGAAVSARAFPGVDARLSRYAYLVSLLPARIVADLGLRVRLRRRRISSYTPRGDTGLLVDAGDPERTARSLAAITGDPAAPAAWRAFHAGTGRLARAVFPTLLEPLATREEMRRRLGDDATWEALVERPLSEALERSFGDDLVRGVVLTDALIGTFAAADDPDLRQNRCFLYHVIGGGTGDWDVPEGGMGALSSELARVAREAGAELRTGTEAITADTDGRRVEVRLASGERLGGRDLLVGAAPAVLDRLLGDAGTNGANGANGANAPEGAQLKVNMLLARLPRLRDAAVTPEEAWAGTFHVNEGYDQLARAYAEAAADDVPALPPCEVYCHSLTDPSVLGPGLREAGAHTLTLFALHLPARLFARDPAARTTALARTLRSLEDVLAEPVEDCLWRGPDGRPCLEARIPQDLETELGLPGGHIFHRDLAWPWAEDPADAGRWGVETEHRNVWLCGAGARRGGGVSGVPGHNAAMALLARR